MKTKIIEMVNSYDELAKLRGTDTIYKVKGKDLIFICKNNNINMYGNQETCARQGQQYGSPRVHLCLMCLFNSWWNIYSPMAFYEINDLKYKKSEIEDDFLLSMVNKAIECKSLNAPQMLKELSGKLDCLNKDQEFGVELEIESSDDKDYGVTFLKIHQIIGNLVYDVCGDSSVRGGTEIRFNYTNLNEWVNSKISDVLSWLKKDKFNNRTGTAGMHIHMSYGSEALTRVAAYKFVENLDDFKKILYPICARKAKVAGVERTKDYGRYGLGNNMTRGFTKHKTFELRCFEATLNPDVFKARLKFAKYLFDFLITELPMDDFFKAMTKEDKDNYKLLLTKENPHVFGPSKEEMLKLLYA